MNRTVEASELKAVDDVTVLEYTDGRPTVEPGYPLTVVHVELPFVVVRHAVKHPYSDKEIRITIDTRRVALATVSKEYIDALYPGHDLPSTTSSAQQPR